RSAPRRRRGRGQGPGVLLRPDAPAPRPRETGTPLAPATPSSAIQRAGHPPIPRRTPARLHLRPRTAQQVVDDDGGVRPAPVDRGRLHDRGRAVVATGSARDL